MTQIGENVKRIIREKGYRQGFIAEKSGYTPKQFSDMLCGRISLKATDIIKIAEAIDATPNDLFGVLPPKGAKIPVATYRTTERK